MMYSVFSKDELYGIKENDTIVVPCCHITKESAIGEFEHFERINTNENQFLRHKFTNEEIDKIIEQLKLM